MRRLCKRDSAVEVRKKIVVSRFHSLLFCCPIINVVTIDHTPGDITS